MYNFKYTGKAYLREKSTTMNQAKTASPNAMNNTSPGHPANLSITLFEGVLMKISPHSLNRQPTRLKNGASLKCSRNTSP